MEQQISELNRAKDVMERELNTLRSKGSEDNDEKRLKTQPVRSTSLDSSEDKALDISFTEDLPEDR